MTNFQIQQFKQRIIREYTEGQLLLSIFRQVWPNLKADYLLLVPDDAQADFIDLQTHIVKHKRKRITITAVMESIDGKDHIFIKPFSDGLLFGIEKINKREKHK